LSDDGQVAHLRNYRPAVLLAMAWLAGLPVVFLLTEGDRPVVVAPIAHLLAVCVAAGIAGAASVALTIAGARRHDGRTVLLSAAFSTMTALLLVHGLATPGVIVGDNGVIALAGGLSLPVGAMVLALTALPSLRRPRDVKEMVLFQIGLFVLVLDLGVIGLLFPDFVPGVPQAGSPAAIVLAVIGGLLFTVIEARALRTFALTHRRTDLLAAVGCAWLGVALVPQLILGYPSLGFYAGHGFEVVGIALVAGPAVMDLIRASGESRPFVGDLSATEIVLSEERFLGPRVRALLLSLEQKDPSTERHTRRVAGLAVRVGEELRLPPASLRHLAVGGLLHDIGKLSVPDAVLTKPDKLTDAEFDEIKKHPGNGLRLLEELGGFSDEVKRLVHLHHERLDGSGYPQGLAGPQLGIGPRLLAVVDVYDALTSDRCYRDAWTERDALALLRKDAGSKMDARCVYALERVLGAVPATSGVREAHHVA
jgi:putative nucleotidyltransferase with HDIG domain